ncbi:EAL domain-containing protein [Bacillus sp. CECT 9360]|uniref:EAL domain-containing protein n=1 Tax=Bacillus sp. CECT 9360 TaxID=2845821 RepID=UPI001E5905D8|nr:EAL domain-containing protein [Bacillus sp. CECT 9360]CAH0344118.1 hypothetical protein BCI9360_00349 [Bacillus sp. CECT 9360]
MPFINQKHHKRNKTEEEFSANLKIDADADLYSYETLTSLFDYHPDIIFTLNVAGDIEAVNKRVDRLGYKPEEINGSFTEFIVNKHLIKTIANFEKTLNGSSENFDISLLHKDGSSIEANITSIPIITNNKVIGVIGIAKDISDIKQKEATLKNIQNGLTLSQMNANIGSWDSDLTTGKIFWSKQIFRILGIHPDEEFVPTYNKLIEFIHPKDRERFDTVVTSSLQNNENYQIEYRVHRGDGKERVISEKADLIVDDDGKAVRLMGIIHDITERKLAEENEEQFQNVYSNIEAGIWSKDLNADKFRFVSAGVEPICGFTQEEIMQEKVEWEKIVYPEDLPGFLSLQRELFSGKAIQHEYRITHQNDGIRWVRDHTIPLLNDFGEVTRLTGIITDITDQKIAVARMEHFAHHDYLTDLPNRRLFDKKLSSLIEESQTEDKQFAVIYLDLDGFKRINDSLGHPVGDDLLISLSERLSNLLTGDNFIARMGGDEFAILVSKYLEIDEIIKFAKTIINEIKHPFFIKDYELFITASIGISMYPQDGLDAAALIKNADSALYRAKELGKDNYQVYMASKDIQAYKSFLLEKDLRYALAKNEFHIHYQPRIDLSQNKIVRAEALIRWKHPEWGLVSPDEFIPLAEESGLIIEIGNWVVRNVCQQLTSWVKEQVPVVPISVNISANSFLKTNWSSTILQILEEMNVDPSMLEFEITESTILQNEEVVRKSVEFVKELGIKLSLDDFGTGFSSISHLKKFQFDYLKIDRTFIEKIVVNRQDANITQSIIQLAHGLDMKVVAEGVETDEQLELLKTFACDEIQGYILSKPIEAEVFKKLLMPVVLKPKVKKKSDKQGENRRKFFRIDLPVPLSCKMTILNIKGKKISLGATEIIMDNIGPGGLHFLSHINMPVRPDITLKIMTEILGEKFHILGHIVWQNEVEYKVYEYGLEFFLDENERERVIMLLNKLSVESRKTTIFQKNLLVTEDKIQYIHSLRYK